MKKEKISIKKVFAYILILAGISFMTLPFLRRSLNNYKAEKSFQDFIENSDQKRVLELEEKAKEYNESIKDSQIAMVDPFLDKNFDSQIILENKDEIFAYLRIPKIDKYLPIYLDASLDHIAKGVGQISGTDIPIGGESRRSVLAGHRGWWTDTMLLYVDDLKNGDRIYVERKGKSLEYEVFSKEVISPYDWEKLEVIEGEDILTLLTCHPFRPPSPNRLLVNAKRVEEKINKPEQVDPEFDQLDDHQQSDQSSSAFKDSQADKQEKVDERPSSKSTLITTATYIAAVLGTITFILVLAKFIKYLIHRK